MVKQNSSTNFDRNMTKYKMRSSHSGPINSSRSYPLKSNHVQVAHSNGCCSSKNKSSNNKPSQPVVPVQQQSQTPRQTAHEKSHLRLDSPDPFYHRYGRIKKNPNQIKRPYQSRYGKNQIHTTRPKPNLQQTNTNKNYQQRPPPPPTPKKNSCCTIL